MVICLEFLMNGTKYKVVIEKKKRTKNTYIKVKDNLSIFVTCNVLTSDHRIAHLLNENQEKIEKMLLKKIKQQKEDATFFFLGKQYDIVYTDSIAFQLGEEKVFMSHDFDLEKWYKKQALSLFQERLDFCYQSFTQKIPYPSLRIRKMKTRWGVCNTKEHIITLNLELIRKELKYLDYVIYHELSHLVYPNHSKQFWHLVEENCPNCKQCRKELNA